jgi:hypothetical protein
MTATPDEIQALAERIVHHAPIGRLPVPPEARVALEVRANLARDRLMRTLDALEQRVTDAKRVRAHVRTIGGVAAVGIALVVGVQLGRAHARAARRGRARWNALARAWKYPERVADRGKRVSFAVDLTRQIAGVVVGASIGPIIKHVMTRLLASRDPRRARGALTTTTAPPHA